ncbi:MAG: citrate synthase/methylcitrate synthase [Caldilineaceae bacterium]|nr:citrate synthase/methylcitrate synthase [Caldilineaceae bacterium]
MHVAESVTTAPATNPPVRAGLEGVIAAETRLSEVDGAHGKLTIAGFPVEVLAARAGFEEVAYLLLYGALPTRTQLDAFATTLVEHRPLPAPTLALLAAAAQRSVPPMDALRMAAGTFDLDLSDAGDDAVAAALLARMPVAVAAYARLLQDAPPVPPDPTLGHAANFLYMLQDDVPTDAAARALETYLITVVDHGLNASTFAARVIIATRSDLVSAVAGALGALKGPLHGGAPGPALDMVFEIGDAARAEPFLRAKLDRGERLMGFGHRVYKVRDPRADVLSRAAQELFAIADAQDANRQLYALTRAVEESAVTLLAEYKPGRNLQTNVEFYTALLLHGLGLPTDLFTPTFAVGRTAGWLAHCREQQATGRLIRPSSRYVGAFDTPWVEVDAR